MGHEAKLKYERMPLALNVIQKKVLCSAEKSSVIWAELNVRTVTTPYEPPHEPGHKGQIKGYKIF